MSNPVRAANFDFSVNLFKQFAWYNEKSLSISPASVAIILAVCYFGSGGETKKQLKQRVFGSQSLDENVIRWVQSVMELAIKPSQGVKLKFANRIYANQAMKFEYLQLIMQTFNATALQADFDQGADLVRENINRWVAQVTDQKITNQIEPGGIGAEATMVLVNALYFSGIWNEKFNAANTKRTNFNPSVGETIPVDMMTATKWKGYFENDQVQILELEYIRNVASFIIILPIVKNGLKSLLQQLTGQELMSWLAGLSPQQVIMQIPKFKIEKSYNLKTALIRLRLNEPFEQQADFSGMSDRGIHISHICHKAYIKLDEQGTIAAATGTTIARRPTAAYADIDEPKTFIADHPFLFLLTVGKPREKNILFIGQFYGK